MIDVVFRVLVRKRDSESGGEKVVVEKIFSSSSFLSLAAFLPGLFPTLFFYLCRQVRSRQDVEIE